MTDGTPEINSESNSASNTNTTAEGPTISDRANEVMGKANEVLGKVDWTQMGKYGKAAGIVALVIVAQILIKVVIDTINFFPLLPGLLELLGVVVVGQWSWQNLTTSEKRNAVAEKVQNLRKEYLG
tara:strand:- start:14 stop:391 length:378 start_codon:yes stop_codon:yes gene_type:complete